MMEKSISVPYKTVFESMNVIMAATVQDDLVRAGFKALLNDVGGGEFHVLVQSDAYTNAKSLLITNPKYGENFSGLGR